MVSGKCILYYLVSIYTMTHIGHLECSSVHLPLIGQAEVTEYFGLPSRSIQNPSADLDMQVEVGRALRARMRSNSMPYVFLGLLRSMTGALLEAEQERAAGQTAGLSGQHYLKTESKFKQQPIHWH
ncbi:hypothetical protein HDE_14346 [Halotydeus destructor]|nr:hypothetical protein HDE_14346 [Halotydeus destructor]